MAERTVTTKRGFILYDDALTSHAGGELFSARHWAKRSSLRGAVGGRGNTWILGNTDDGWVLRHYRRGGLVRHFTRDFYLWHGLENTRPWREWRLLAYLYMQKLPVPQPVAAQVIRHGLVYRGDLITRLIPETQSLAARLAEGNIGRLPWIAIGACIRRFHAAGVFHADLNAHNILIGNQEHIYLVDFDRGERRAPARRWQQENLRRLLRSLRKLAIPSVVERRVWPELLTGYNRAA
ncbi:MAG: 3-deoxy-D-manno-octulosonic acid kinase [Gammaproteobacteria bacterium]|nr:3-deoxy-D-manno-octulosonic acid kinase [Gammaproteobacteria bacterium]MDE2345496.1 3-deoxy-D-manno-octulosonic acid kinase [Gammaproteobacteria bacterium]